MPENWKRPLISHHERYVNEALDEIRKTNDLDLWEEAASKLADVLIVYRRAMKRQVIRFSDDRQRELSEMAWTHAYAEAFSEEIDEDVS